MKRRYMLGVQNLRYLTRAKPVKIITENSPDNLSLIGNYRKSTLDQFVTVNNGIPRLSLFK